MKSALVVVGTAVAVVGLYFLVAEDGFRGAVLEGVPLDRPEVASGGPATGEEILRELPGVWPRHGPTSVSRGLPGARAAHPEVATRLDTIRSLVRGQDVRQLDRGQMTRTLWEIERALRPEDVPFLLKCFEDDSDPSFRWALSWLFERIKDDRMVDALEKLLPDHPRRATDAIASVGTPHAFERLAERVPDLEDDRLRAHAMTRFGQGRWPGAEEYLAGVWADEEAGPIQRMSAVEALAARVESPRAPRLALDVALGPAVPVGDLGDWSRRYPERDLREPAVMAVMRLGDQASVLELLGHADAPGADPALARMVDRHLGGFRGPDVSRVVLERIARRGRISEGEAAYLMRTANRDDVGRLERLRDGAADPKVRNLLDAAIVNARTR